jgi:hypothetical protein
MARIPDWFRKVVEYGEQVRNEADKHYARPAPTVHDGDPVNYQQFKSWSKADREGWLQLLKARNKKKKSLRGSGTSV